MKHAFNHATILTLCVFLVVLAACNSTKHALVGKWRTEGLAIFQIDNPTFESDGSLIVPAGRGTYEFVDRDHIKVSLRGMTNVYEVKISGELLTITDQFNNRQQYTKLK